MRHPPIRVGTLEGVPHRHRQQAADRVVSQNDQQPLQIFTRQIGPRCIVHQHPVLLTRSGSLQRIEPRQHRVGALTPAWRAPHPRITGHGQLRPVGIVRSQAHHGAQQVGMIEKTIEGVFDDAAPGDLQVLLGPVGGHSRTDAGGRDHQPEFRAHSVSR